TRAARSSTAPWRRSRTATEATPSACGWRATASTRGPCRAWPTSPSSAGCTSCAWPPAPTRSRCWPRSWRGPPYATSRSPGRRCTTSSSASPGPRRRPPPMLRKIVIIALREYNAAVRTKAFVVSLVFLPVLMLGSFGVQALLRNKVDTTAKHFAVIDRSEGEGVLAGLQATTERRNAAGLRDASGRQVRPEYVLERVAPPESPDALNAVRLEQSDRV